MSVIKILSVGSYGVGKSTIGNCLVEGSPMGTSFESSQDPGFHTRDSKWVTGSDCSYCDLPGIPVMTNADKTREYYDIVIKEARKEINVILFVFRKERIDAKDVNVFSKAKMLFIELNKLNAIKVLLINDMTPYLYAGSASENDYRGVAEAVKDCTGMSFSHVMSMTCKTMIPTLTNLKKLLSKTTPQASPTLKTYVELKAYVEELNKKQNYEQIAYEEEMAKISQMEMELNELGVDACTLYEKGASVNNDEAIWLPFCTVKTHETSPDAMEAASKTVEVDIKKKELDDAKKRSTKEEIEKTAKLLQDACQSFTKFDNDLRN